MTAPVMSPDLKREESKRRMADYTRGTAGGEVPHYITVEIRLNCPSAACHCTGESCHAWPTFCLHQIMTPGTAVLTALVPKRNITNMRIYYNGLVHERGSVANITTLELVPGRNGSRAPATRFGTLLSLILVTVDNRLFLNCRPS